MSTDEAIILVGGAGTRLRSVVSDVPKPLAPVAGRPFLAWVLDALAAQEMRRVVLATGYLASMVEQTIGRRWKGMEIAYSVEPEPLGTGGAVRLAAQRLQGDRVHVLNGDTFLRYAPSMLETVVDELDTAAGIALAGVPDTARYGAVDVTQGRVTGFSEKGRSGQGWINAGCYFLGTGALDRLPRGGAAFSLETGLLLPLSEAGLLAGDTRTEGFIDIGVPDDYARAQTLFARATA